MADSSPTPEPALKRGRTGAPHRSTGPDHLPAAMTSRKAQSWRRCEFNKPLQEREEDVNALSNDQSIHRKLVKTFTEQTDEQLQSIIAQAEDTYSNDWSKRSLADRKKILRMLSRSSARGARSSRSTSRSRWASCSPSLGARST